MTERLRRLLLVVPAARAKPGIPVTELAKALACDPDDLRDDIGLLACVGQPPFQPDDLIDIELRDDRVWVTLPQAFSQPSRLLATEAAALTLAARGLGANDPTLRSATEKLSKAILPAQRSLYEGLASKLGVTPSASTPDVEAVLARAIAGRKEVEILYYTPTERTARPRVVRPRKLATANGVRYLSAQNVAGKERFYRLERISEATRQETTFAALPVIDVEAELTRTVSLEHHGDMPCATVRFTATVATAAKLRHPEARALPDGSVEAEVPYSTLPWLVSYAFSWGGQAIVTAPPEARDAFAHAIDAALESLKENS